MSSSFCINCGNSLPHEPYISAFCCYECDEDWYLCEAMNASYGKARELKTFGELMKTVEQDRQEIEEAVDMLGIWDEIELEQEESRIKDLLPIQFHQPGIKCRDGFKRYIHARGDYQDDTGRDAPIAKKFLKREASRARRRMSKVVVLDLAA